MFIHVIYRRLPVSGSLHIRPFACINTASKRQDKGLSIEERFRCVDSFECMMAFVKSIVVTVDVRLLI